MRGLLISMDNLCKLVHVVEGAVNTLRTDMKDLKGKVPIEEGDMSMLAEAIRAPKNTLRPIDV